MKTLSIRRFRPRRLFLAAFLALFLTGALGVSFYGVTRRIPSTIYFRAGQAQNMDLRIPATGEVRAVSGGQYSNVPKESLVIDLSGPVTMLTGGRERYDMEVRLFGILPLKKVDIRVIEDQELIPMGIPVGLYMECKGVLVVGIAEFESLDGETVAPAKNLLMTGDYVLAVNGKKIQGKEELALNIEECRGNPITLTVRREGKERDVELRPVRNQAGQYKVGIWIRDNVQGVGTMTFLDGEGRFGALGHGIADVDTGIIMDVEGGTLFQTEIVSMRRGEHGNPGELTGRIVYDEKYALGEISENSIRGVYGTCNDGGQKMAVEAPLPIGLKQEITLGPAQILSTIDAEVECFDVEITKVHLEQDGINRGIELLVTDQGLLERAGGIVQGMSGSPIIQNGKIIGAVTHVLVNAPEKGYGIFIENMLEDAR